MPVSRPEWSPPRSLRRKDHFVSHIDLERNSPTFIPSYEQTDCVNMFDLMSFEYARIWKKERDEFYQYRVKVEKKFIKNDYWRWIEKRKPKETKECRAQGLKIFDVKKKKRTKETNIGDGPATKS